MTTRDAAHRGSQKDLLGQQIVSTLRPAEREAGRVLFHASPVWGVVRLASFSA